MAEEDKLKKAINALYGALTCAWEDNGNIMAEAVRDYVIMELAEITGKTFSEVEENVMKKVNQAQL